MNAWIKRLHPSTEFLIVVLVAFGLPIISSSLVMVGRIHLDTLALSDDWAYVLLMEELLILAGIVLFLRARGWRAEDFNLQVTWRLWGMGLILMIGAYALSVVSYLLVKLVWTAVDNAAVQLNAGRLGLLSVALVSVVNPVFEEILAVGYVVGALQRRQKARLGVVLSALLRGLYHGYQGPLAVIDMMLMGLLFAYAYYRWNSLWPLIVAHGFMDVLALLARR